MKTSRKIQVTPFFCKNIFSRPWSFLKRNHDVYRFPKKASGIADYKNIPINLINYGIALNRYCLEGSNKTTVRINGENVCYSIDHQLLVLIHVKFLPEIICVVGDRVQQLGGICSSSSVCLWVSFC